MQRLIKTTFTTLSLVCFFLAITTTANATTPCQSVRGDITLDGEADVFDVQCHALAVIWELGGATGDAPVCMTHGLSEIDENCDGHIDVTDILLTISSALALPWSTELDGDQDDCIDVCETELFLCDEGLMNPSCDTGIGSCDDSPCDNGGACIDHSGGYICDCVGTGFEGFRCETPSGS